MSVIEIKDKQLDSIIKQDGKVVIDCYAPWCGPCKMLAPIMDELANEFKDIKFYKINIDDNEDVSIRYNVMSIPTILVFENGELVKQTVGFKSKDKLTNKIK